MGTGTMHISHLMTHAKWNERPQPSSHKQRMENKHWASICLSYCPLPSSRSQASGARQLHWVYSVNVLMRKASHNGCKDGTPVAPRLFPLSKGDLFFTPTALVNDSFIYMAQYSLHSHYWHVIPQHFCKASVVILTFQTRIPNSTMCLRQLSTYKWPVEMDDLLPDEKNSHYSLRRQGKLDSK